MTTPPFIVERLSADGALLESLEARTVIDGITVGRGACAKHERWRLLTPDRKRVLEEGTGPQFARS